MKLQWLNHHSTKPLCGRDRAVLLFVTTKKRDNCYDGLNPGEYNANNDDGINKGQIRHKHHPLAKMNLPEGKVGALHNALRQMGGLTAYYVYEEDMAKRNKR